MAIHPFIHDMPTESSGVTRKDTFVSPSQIGLTQASATVFWGFSTENPWVSHDFAIKKAARSEEPDLQSRRSPLCSPFQDRWRVVLHLLDGFFSVEKGRVPPHLKDSLRAKEKHGPMVN